MDPLTQLDRGSRNRLTPQMTPRFVGDSLFERVARAVCRAGCLPRKELYEAWEVARRVRRRFRGGRVIDLACGHGLLAQLLLVLDDSSEQALAVDRSIPASAEKLSEVMTQDWPRLRERIKFMAADLTTLELQPGDLVVSVHACGDLTDLVLARAAATRARVAVLPCCHRFDGADLGGLEGWLDGALAVDVTRAARLRSQGYRVWTQTIPADITPQNRLLLGEPLG
jgi:SAM-dependent methyltransferase